MHAGYPLDAEAILLCESDGTPEEVAEEDRAHERGDARERRDRDPPVARRSRAAEVLVRAARPPSPLSAASCPTTTAWTAPSRASAAGRVLAAIDGVVRRVRPAVRQRVPRRRRQPASADHVRCQRARRTGAHRAFGARILELCVEVGGTITGEHGVGIEKINQMCVQFQTRELAPSTRSSGLRSRRHCSIRARPCRR